MMRPIVATASLLAVLAGTPGVAAAQNGPGMPPGPSSMPNPDMMPGQDMSPGPGHGQPPGMAYEPGPGGEHQGVSRMERREANQQDRKFVAEAGSAGLAEVAAGHLAMRRAATPAVGEFGRWMVTDHTEMGDMLGYRAQRAGLTPPSQMSEKDRAAIGRLDRYNGAEFDMRYLADQVEGHKQALELFKEEAQSGENPGLRGFAQHMQRVITEHLAEAQELQGAPESGTAHSAQVSAAPPPMPDAKSAPPNLHAGTSPALRNDLNATGAAQIKKEGK
jgi:putative membrane protein